MAEKLEKSVAKLSIYILALGVSLGLGETLALEFSFFNSSTYVDFLIKSVKAIPLLIFFIIFLMFLHRFLIWPFKRILEIKNLVQKEPVRKKQRLVYELLDFVTLILIAVFIPLSLYNIFTGSNLLNTHGFFLVGVLPMMTLTIALRRDLHAPLNRVSDEKKMLEDKINFFVVNTTGQGISLLLIIIFGFLSIVFQKENTVDAMIYLQKDSSRIEGNLLATNSSSLALYSNGKLLLIPRDQVEKIQYEKSIYVFTRESFETLFRE